VSVAHRLLRLGLFALSLLYAAWFGRGAEWVALALFALPPLLLAWRLPRGGARVAFWAGVLALLWFSHGVMVAWTRPPERPFALGAVLLSLLVVFASSIPGLRARFGRRAA
jgi:uncharacterized membrane protein